MYISKLSKVSEIRNVDISDPIEFYTVGVGQANGTLYFRFDRGGFNLTDMFLTVESDEASLLYRLSVAMVGHYKADSKVAYFDKIHRMLLQSEMYPDDGSTVGQYVGYDALVASSSAKGLYLPANSVYALKDFTNTTTDLNYFDQLGSRTLLYLFDLQPTSTSSSSSLLLSTIIFAQAGWPLAG